MAETRLADPVVAEADLQVAGDISRAMMRFFRATHHFKTRMIAEHNVDQTTFAVLSTLTECGPLRSTLLASRLHSDPSTISRQVAHLVQQGLVERTADPEDGRASLLGVTDTGREHLSEARRYRDRKLAELMRHWPAADRQTLALLLDRLANDLTALSTSAQPASSQTASSQTTSYDTEQK